MRLIYKIKELPYKLKMAWQRATKGYCDSDSWDIYTWFSTNIVLLLTEMRNNRHGYPYLIKNDKGDMFTDEDWGEVLTEMITCFRMVNDNSIWERKLDNPSDKIILQDLKEDSQIKQHYLERGMELFTKYFWDLWD
jgi:hypothetical protein